MAQVRSRENTFKVDLSNFPKRPSIEELQKFVLVNLGLAVGQVKRFQVNHAQNCVHVKCSELKVAQDAVAMHDGKHVMEINKTKVTVRLVMEDGGVEVKIHDLSENVTNDDIVAFLRNYGDVLSIREVSWGESFPLRGMSSGIRIAKMILHRHIKSFATILGENTLISYRGQPMTCRHCTQTQHIGMSCVENKKLLGQKSDLSARLKNASGSTPSSYAGVLNSVAPATNTLIPEFSGTILGPVIQKRPPPIVPESMTLNNAQSETSKSVTGHPVDVSMISGDNTSSAQPSSPTDVAELSAGLKTSGGGSSSNVQDTHASVTELSAGSALSASGGGASIVCQEESQSPAGAELGAEEENKEADEMETENPSAVEVVVELSTQQLQEKQQPDVDEDAEMSTLSDTITSTLVSPFNPPFPATAPAPAPDIKKVRSLSSMSGSESEIGDSAEFTEVKPKRRPGRPKKPKIL